MKMIHISRQKVTGIVATLCYLTAGILLIVKPEIATDLSVWLLAALLAAMGVLWLIRYFLASPEAGAASYDLAEALLALSAAALIGLRRDLFTPLLPFLWAAFLIVSGYIIFQAAIDYLRLRYVRWWILLIGAAATILLGVVAFMTPAFLTGHMPLFTGITLLFDAAFSIYSFVLNYLYGKGKLPKAHPKASAPKAASAEKTADPVQPAAQEAPATVMEELAHMAEKDAASAKDSSEAPEQ